MRILVFDPSYGCAGDMILGAFVSAGVSFDKVRSELKKLRLGGYSISRETVQRNAVSAVKINVTVEDRSSYRHLKQITEVIEASDLSVSVKDNARKVFARLADAEAEVHSTTPEKIHFHEVGAVDAMVDIVGACICIETLGVDEVYSRPVALGSGTVNCEHGVLPVPAPATAKLVKGFPVKMYNSGAELTTPTGAAIVTTLAQPLYSPIEGTSESVGYGAGTRKLDNHPNLMRIFVMQSERDYERDTVIELQTNIDDMSPQVYSYLFGRLFDAGALDVYLTPIQMKKNRPGQLLTVLCQPDRQDALQMEIFEQTSTSGIRYQQFSRVKLPRKSMTVSTPLGDCRVKVFEMPGRRRIVPEYESVKRIADSAGMPYLEAHDAIVKFIIDIDKER